MIFPHYHAELYYCKLYLSHFLRECAFPISNYITARSPRSLCQKPAEIVLTTYKE